MNAMQIIYFLIFVFSIYFVYSGFKNNLKYKKENMKPLLYLDADDKTRHMIGNGIIILIVAIASFLAINTVRTGVFTLEIFFMTLIFPVLMVLLYIPLIKKNMVSTLGIHKRGALIRWNEIKAVSYLKPDKKDRVKVKIIYTYSGRDTSTELTFGKDDSQLGTFRETVKEYRRNRKKENKSGK